MYNKTSNGVKKILYFITQSEYGGAQRYIFDLANNLKDDYEVAVALGERGNNGKLAKILDENKIKTFIIPRLKRSISPLNDVSALFEIIKLIKNYQPDIIHLNSSKISILGSIASLFTKTKTVYTVHGWVFNEPLPLLLKWFYIFAEKITARFKHKIICVSEYDKKVALKYKIAPVEKLVTIHNGLSPINFYSKNEAKKIISRIAGRELRDENILIGSIGNLYKTKGFEYFVEAANILISRNSWPAYRRLTFIIIGEGNEKEKIEALVKKYNLENNFILTGRIDEAARLLPALDIYVCSSVKEGFPYSILEAMQAGLPIVATDVGGIPEMIENNKTGLITKPADSDSSAKKIKNFLDNQALAKELGQRAKSRSALEFDLEKMIEATKKVYN